MTDRVLIDFHCHLDLYPDHAAAVAECEREKVFTLAVTTTPRAWPRNNELASATRHVRAALGLHPQLIADHADELAIWESHLPEARYIGEVGLDAGPRFHRSFETQKRVFERILRASSEVGGKILTIHSVRATATVLDLLERNFPAARGKAVLHWFTGTVAESRRAVDLGCYFSINAKMLETEKHRAMVASLPMDRLLTETDGPFVNIDGRPARPLDVGMTVKTLARVRGDDQNAMASAIADNLKTIVS